MRKKYSLNLDFARDIRAQRNIVLKEQDSVSLKFYLFDDGVPLTLDNHKIRLFVRKADGTMLYQVDDYSVETNSILFNLHRQATTSVGFCYGELELIDENDEEYVTTKSFIYKVESKVVDIEGALKSENHAYFLKEIEDFIKQSQIDIAEYKETVKELLEKVDDANAKLDQFNKDLSEADTNLKEDKEDALTAIENLKNNALMDLSNSTQDGLEELEDKKTESLAEIERTTSTGLTSIISKTAIAKKEIEDLKNTSKQELEILVDDEKHNIRTLGYELQRDIKTLGDESIKNMDEMLNSSLHLIEDTTQESINKMDEKIEEIKTEINNAEQARVNLESTTEIANETKEALEQTIENSNTAKEELEGTIEDANTTKEELEDLTAQTKETIEETVEDALEEMENMKNGSVEGVDEAVKLAEKRLQELSVKESWNISQTAREEEERLQTSLAQKTSELREGLEATTDGYLNRIQEEGQDIVDLVANLEADISQGLADIQSSVNTGKTEIKDLSDSYLDRIEAEGEEIVQAVANLEMTTAEQIKQINTISTNSIQSINNVASSKRTELRNYTSELKEEINNLTENKLEAIENAGDSKLEEIEAIVGVTKTDVVELLETTRGEINTHRENIDSIVNEGINNIDSKIDEGVNSITSLKSSSISEMTTVKDNLLEELLGAEVELEKDFEALHQEIVADINNIGNSKTEALNNLIERINALEIEIEKNLINSDKKAENLENVMQNVDNKMADITPVLDDLDELRSLCNELIAQNKTAKTSLEDLQFWTLEADVRIIELRRLILEAQRYEEVVQRWIDSRGGNHEEIETRLDALEQSVIALDDIIAQLENIYATKEELLDYATKKELKTAIEDAVKKSNGLGVVGKLGAGLKIATELMPTKLKELKTPQHLIDAYGEVKHSYVYEIYPSNGKQTWYKIIFFCNLDDPQNTGKYVSFKDGVFTFNGLERDKDYAIATTTGTFTEDPFYTSGSLSTINHNDTRTYSYYMDFNLYSENGEEILVNNPQRAGISNLNEAVENGFYILDMDMSDYQELSNAPTLEGSVARGYLEVIGNTQRLNIIDGQVFIRENGGAWTRIDNNRKNTIATIGKSNQIKTPDLFKTVPATLRAFHREKERIVMFRATEDYYYVVRINSSYTYALSHNNTKLVINGSYVPGLQTFWYSVSKGEWTNRLSYGTSTVSNQEISINQNFFEVYHSDFDITNTVNNKWSISKGLVANYNIKETIKDFNNAVEAGYYDVNIQGVADGVSNSPQDSIQGILKVEKNNNVIYQELTSNNNKTVFKRVFNGSWSSWRYVGDEYVGVVGLTPKASVDKKGVFDNVPNPPTIRDSEYVGKYMYSYLSSSKHYYICTYLYKNTDTNKTPYLSTTEYTNNTGSYHYIQGYDYDSSTCRAFMKYEDDAEWSTGTSVQSMTDLQTAYIYHHDMPIYTGGKNKTGIYREAMNADIIGDLDGCKKAGKYYVNVKKDEYNQIGNMPLVKIEKDLETTLYVNINGEKILQEITIEGITYTREIGKAWTGLNNSFVKNDVVAHINGVEPEATVEYEIETANIEDIYASCPVPNNHKTPYGTIDFKDNSGKYYRLVTYGKGSGFYLYQSGSSKSVGAYAYDQRYITRYTWDNGVWTEWTSTSSSYTYTYVSIGAGGEILNSNLDICKGTSNTAFDKTTIVRKADIKTDVKVINDFNEATTEGRYVVNIEENTEALNAPATGILLGTLEVIKVNDIIKQLFTNSSGEYTRVFNEEWTEWKSAGLTTETVEAMINTMIGAPKAELISDINEIIRGI